MNNNDFEKMLDRGLWWAIKRWIQFRIARLLGLTAVYGFIIWLIYIKVH